MNHAINATTLETHTHIPVSGVVRLYFQGLCVHMLNLAGYARARSRCVVIVRTTHMRVRDGLWAVVSRKAVHLRLYGTALQDRV